MKLLISLSLVLSLISSVPFWLAETLTAASDIARWASYSIPKEGESSGWFLAGGSDVNRLALDDSGNLYACVTGLTGDLYKSKDGGSSWYVLGSIAGDIVDIAIGDDGRVIY